MLLKHSAQGRTALAFLNGSASNSCRKTTPVKALYVSGEPLEKKILGCHCDHKSGGVPPYHQLEPDNELAPGDQCVEAIRTLLAA